MKQKSLWFRIKKLLFITHRNNCGNNCGNNKNIPHNWEDTIITPERNKDGSYILNSKNMVEDVYPVFRYKCKHCGVGKN